MVTIAYADGSGKGWACAMIQSEEGYFKTYFKRARARMIKMEPMFG